MSVVWTTVALTLFLMPGFAFLAGIAWPTRFRRGLQLQNPALQLVAVVGVSFLVHSIRTVLLGGIEHPKLFPAVDLGFFFAIVGLKNAETIRLADLTMNLEQFRLQIFSYILTTVIIGAATGRLVFRYLPEVPAWFLPGRRHVAHVLTKIEASKTSSGVPNLLMYKGILSDIETAPDGGIRALTLQQPSRRILRLGDDPHADAESEPIAGEGEIRSIRFAMSEITNVVFEEIPSIFASLEIEDSTALEDPPL